MVFLVGLGPTPLVSNDSPWINVSLKIVNCSCVVPPICQNLQWNTIRLFFFLLWFFWRSSFPGLSQRYLFIGVRRNLNWVLSSEKEKKKGRGRLTPILQVFLTLFKEGGGRQKLFEQNLKKKTLQKWYFGTSLNITAK